MLTSHSQLDLRFSIRMMAERNKTLVEIFDGYDYERYIIPEIVVETVESWLDYQNADAGARARLLLKGLLQCATNPKE